MDCKQIEIEKNISRITNVDFICHDPSSTVIRNDREHVCAIVNLSGFRVFVKYSEGSTGRYKHFAMLDNFRRVLRSPILYWYSGDWSIWEYIEGKNLDMLDMSQIKMVLRWIHELQNSNVPANCQLPVFWTDKLIEIIEFPISEGMDWLHHDCSKSELSRNIYMAFEKLIKYFRSNCLSLKPVISHGDVHHKNCLITASNKLYICDWDSIAIRPALYDIAYFIQSGCIFGQSEKIKDLWLEYIPDSARHSGMLDTFRAIATAFVLRMLVLSKSLGGTRVLVAEYIRLSEGL